MFDAESTKIVLRSEGWSGKRANLRTAAASNNADYTLWSLYDCLFASFA